MLKNYIKIARPDHWFKNVFMLPGMVMALYYTQFNFDQTSWLKILIGILATCLIASANYVINEWLDLEFDKFHPVKKNRPAVAAKLNPGIIYAEYALLAIAGLGLSLLVSVRYMAVEFFLLFMGFMYNVKPFRSKDKAYLDVLSESVNNPIRFVLGWFLIGLDFFPPSSILIAYWMGGAFLMATKRFAEYRFIGDAETAGLYRRSFKVYTEERLLISTVFYALCSSFFLAIFLVKHRIELLVSFPFLALLFAWYLHIGFEKNSIVQAPEKLYKRKWFVIFNIFLCILFFILLRVDLPWLNLFLKNY